MRGCWWCVVLICLLAGCSASRLESGTTGVLTMGGQGLAEVQVNVHRLEGGRAELVGFGITRAEGKFVLMQPEAEGPLPLEAGEYRITLESVGASPVELPREYSRIETTPLKVTRTGDSEELVLSIPSAS